MARRTGDKRSTDAIGAINDAYYNLVNKGNLMTEVPVPDDLGPTLEVPNAKTEILFFPLPTGTDDILEFSKGLFYMAANPDVTASNEMFYSIYLNIMRIFMNGQTAVMKRAIVQGGMTWKDVTSREAETILNEHMPEYALSDRYQAALFDMSLMKALAGIFTNFITKKLVAANHQEWYNRRVRAYASPNACDPTRQEFSFFKPTLKFVDAANNFASSCFPFKKVAFLTVQAIANEGVSAFSKSCNTTMVYFYMAELTCFTLVIEQLVIKNPGLLGWNALMKYHPALQVATNAFRQMGDQAPYCRFLYPSESLKMFQAQNLGLLPAVAAEISKADGSKSYQNYKGTNYVLPADMAEKTRALVRLYNCTDTKTTRGIIDEILHNTSENNPFIKEIRTPDGQFYAANEANLEMPVIN